MEVKERMSRCGECNVCCDVLSIPEFKDANTVCKYYDQGCKIYKDRPDACINFECEYVKRNWNIRLRPDNCGTIVFNDKLPPNMKKRYYAIRFKDDVDLAIMKQIEFIKEEDNAVIKRMDVRSKREL